MPNDQLPQLEKLSPEVETGTGRAESAVQGLSVAMAHLARNPQLAGQLTQVFLRQAEARQARAERQREFQLNLIAERRLQQQAGETARHHFEVEQLAKKEAKAKALTAAEQAQEKDRERVTKALTRASTELDKAWRRHPGLVIRGDRAGTRNAFAAANTPSEGFAAGAIATFDALFTSPTLSPEERANELRAFQKEAFGISRSFLKGFEDRPDLGREFLDRYLDMLPTPAEQIKNSALDPTVEKLEVGMVKHYMLDFSERLSRAALSGGSLSMDEQAGLAAVLSKSELTDDEITVALQLAVDVATESLGMDRPYLSDEDREHTRRILAQAVAEMLFDGRGLGPQSLGETKRSTKVPRGVDINALLGR